MTPLERLIDNFITGARQRAWYASAEWERKAKREIHAMAVVHHRGIGQRIRFARERISNLTKEQR